jgi:hypothetical protein
MADAIAFEKEMPEPFSPGAIRLPEYITPKLIDTG